MGLSDQFKDKAKDLADQAKSALGDHGSKAEETEQKAREQAEGMMPGGQESADDQQQQEGESS
ncbi:hypothetical protein ACFVT9_13210 [Kitasatospora cineracea]|uniref:hypothetical protein n=1 Tax=Kitasatospora TaxID=2063 RepID=UPI0004C43AF2|nr:MULTISPECIES: hypothetical protein [unclassified Kitasatospora]WAL71890.1 hypothetical protein OU787_10505 [Kitasatospora sp. YST-16]WNW37934.1 hypothetical protein RKE32_10465 [Streptomyces sp. Li-HN-5-13]